MNYQQLPDNAVLHDLMSLGVRGLLLQVGISERERYLLFIRIFIRK